MKETNIMRIIITSLLLLLLCSGVFAQKQVMKAVNATKAYAKPLPVAALNRATTLEPLGNTFTERNTAVQFVADKAVLKQMEKEQPKLLEFSIPISEDKTMVLELIPMDIFGDKYKVMDAQNQTVNVQKGVFYKGIVKGDDNSIVSLALSNGELSGIISNDRGNYVLGKIKNASNYIFYNDHELLEKSKFDCGVAETVEHHVEETRQTALTETLICSPRPVQIYFEADNAVFVAQGSNITTATTFVNALFAQVAVLYANEGITIQMSQLKIWDTADPYISATDTYDMLDLFTPQVGTTFNGDLAHLISARSLDGGVAYVDKLCTKGTGLSADITSTVVNVPVYSWNVMVVAHELGHNFGSRHTHSCTWPGGAIDNCSDTEGNCPRGPAPVNGGTIMSYCHLVAAGINLANGFGPLPGNLIRNKVNFCIYTSRLAVMVVSTSANTTAACNGFQIVVSATGGTGAKTFSLSPNVGSQVVSGTFTGLTPGTYVFTTTDANGCTATTSTTITEAFAFTTVTEMVSCDGTTAGRIVATPTNNSNAFNYSISPNVGTQSPSGRFNNLPTGTYTITATFVGDATCPVTRSATLVARSVFAIDAPSVLKANAGVSDGRIIVSGISGSKPYTATLSPNVGTQPFAGAFTGLAVGTYAATVTDANGCTASTSNIVVGTLPSLTVNTSPVSLCNGSSVNLNSLISTTGGSSVVWSKKPQAVQGASGSLHHFVLLSNGTLTGWGENSNGQLTFPTFAAPIKQISANLRHSTALLTNGSVVGWGDNGKGQNNIPTFAAPPIKISTGGNYNLALLLDGSLIGWGYNFSGEVNIPVFPSRVKDIQAGLSNNLALLVDGTLKGWGAGYSPLGVLNTPPIFTAPVTGMSMGPYHALAMSSTGQVKGWGANNNYGELTIPTFAAPVKQLLAGNSTSYALLTNGTTVVWGDGAGTTHVPPIPPSGVTPLSISSVFTSILTVYTNGSAVSWGQNRGSGEIRAYDAEALSNATVTPPVGTTTYYVVVRNADGDYKTGEVTINMSVAPAAPTVHPCRRSRSTRHRCRCRVARR